MTSTLKKFEILHKDNMWKYIYLKKSRSLHLPLWYKNLKTTISIFPRTLRPRLPANVRVKAKEKAKERAQVRNKLANSISMARENKSGISKIQITGK